MDAIKKQDIEKELTFVHPNVVVTWHNAEVSRGRDGVRAYLARMLTGPNKVLAAYTADLTVDELSILYGGDTAISWGGGVEHFTLASGRTIDLPARWSATLVKENGTWLIAAVHASDNLFDNPMLNMAKTFAFWVGVIGFVVGAIVAAAIVMIVKRRRGQAA